MLYKENKVPHYQRLYQRNDGVRLWMKVRIPGFHRLREGQDG